MIIVQVQSSRHYLIEFIEKKMDDVMVWMKFASPFTMLTLIHFGVGCVYSTVFKKATDIADEPITLS